MPRRKIWGMSFEELVDKVEEAGMYGDAVFSEKVVNGDTFQCLTFDGIVVYYSIERGAEWVEADGREIRRDE